MRDFPSGAVANQKWNWVDRLTWLIWPFCWWLWGMVHLPDDAAILWLNQGVHFQGHFDTNPVESLFLLSNGLAALSKWTGISIGFTILGTFIGWAWAWGVRQLPLPRKLMYLALFAGWSYLLWDFSLTAAAALVCFVGLWNLLNACNLRAFGVGFSLFVFGVLIRDKGAVSSFILIFSSLFIFKSNIYKQQLWKRAFFAVSVWAILVGLRNAWYPSEFLALNDAFTRALDYAECGALSQAIVEDNLIILALYNWFLGDPAVHLSKDIHYILDTLCKPAPGQFIRNIFNTPAHSPDDLYSLAGGMTIVSLIIQLESKSLLRDFRWPFVLIGLLLLLAGLKLVARVWVPVILLWTLLAMIHQEKSKPIGSIRFCLSLLLLVATMVISLRSTRATGLEKYAPIQRYTQSHPVLISGPASTLLVPLAIRSENQTVRFLEVQPIEIMGGWYNLTPEYQRRVQSAGGFHKYLIQIKQRTGRLYLLAHAPFVAYLARHLKHYYNLRLIASPIRTVQGGYGSILLYELEFIQPLTRP